MPCGVSIGHLFISVRDIHFVEHRGGVVFRLREADLDLLACFRMLHRDTLVIIALIMVGVRSVRRPPLSTGDPRKPRTDYNATPTVLLRRGRKVVSGQPGEAHHWRGRPDLRPPAPRGGLPDADKPVAASPPRLATA